MKTLLIAVLLSCLSASAFAVGPGHFGPGPLRPHEPVIVFHPVGPHGLGGKH